MGIKDRIGFEIYEGSLRKVATSIGEFGLQRGLLGRSNSYRALYLLFKEGKVSPDDLKHYYKRFEPLVQNKKIFIMHIPKTAGTSLRTTLEEAIGVPAVTSYQKETEFSAIQWEEFSFWPLLSGHVHIDYFPKTHVGITTFRESRSRTLSEFRQIERRPEHRRREILALFGFATKDEDRMTWGQFRNFDLLHTFYWFFTSGHPDNWREFITTASKKEIRASIEIGLQRIQSAAWSHDSEALEVAASNILEVPVKLHRVNVFTESDTETIHLTQDDIRKLEEFASLDDIVIDVASTLGLVPKLSQSEKDALFEQDVQRLRFKLP